MSNYKCLCELLNDNNLNLEHLIEYYISYISIFYGKDVEYDDMLQTKVNDLQEYINRKIGVM